MSCTSFIVLFTKRPNLPLNLKGWSGEVLSLKGPLREVKKVPYAFTGLTQFIAN